MQLIDHSIRVYYNPAANIATQQGPQCTQLTALLEYIDVIVFPRYLYYMHQIARLCITIKFTINLSLPQLTRYDIHVF